MRVLLVTAALLSGVAFGELPQTSQPQRQPAESRGNGAFELGKRQFESGNYVRALDLFAQAIGQSREPAQRNRAYYYQGLTLFEMGYYYSSYVSFRNVLLTADGGNKEVYEKAIKNAISITDKLNMVDRIGKVLDKLPANVVPPSVGPQTHFAIGVANLAQGNDDKASAHFKSVPPESNYYLKSLFFLGVLATKKKNYREAIFYNQKILEGARGRKELFPLAEIARLNLARSTYSAGEIERSIEYYSQFLSSSPHWLTVLLEASWPLMRVNDTTVSLGNLHTILSPFYREDLVGEAYILRATILFQLCKYEEMRKTLAQFFQIYDPVVRAMQTEQGSLGGADGYFRAFTTQKGINRAFLNFAKRDQGIEKQLKVLELLKQERAKLATLGRNEQIRRMAAIMDETIKGIGLEIGAVLQRMHKRKLQELVEQREQANYLKVEIVTGEKELIEGQKGLPPKRVVDVETSVAAGYHFWPFRGEFWEDELGTYVYTTESACVN